MGENEKPAAGGAIREEIIKKAREDKNFKKALMENPKEILGRFGVQVPAEVEVKVVEESPGVVYLVLPVNPAELTDKQLDGVGGGLDLPGGWCLCRGHWDTNCWLLGSGGD